MEARALKNFKFEEGTRSWVFPNRKIVEHIRREYPVGTRVELVRMHDKQAPPVGMKGTVLGVDDTASLLMHWIMDQD